MGTVTQLLIVSLLWSFEAPTEREDGTPLTIEEIKGYSAYIDGAMQTKPIVNTATTIEYPGAGCLTMRTVDTEGQVSELSEECCKGTPDNKWTVRFASSWEIENWLMKPEYSFNRGNPGEHKLWHSRYTPTEATFPHRLQIDMGRNHQVTGFKLKPREGGGNATPKGYTFSLSEDGVSWHIVSSGSFPPGDQLHIISFPEERARYFYFNFTSNQDGLNQQVSVDEIYITTNNPNPPIMVE